MSNSASDHSMRIKKVLLCSSMCWSALTMLPLCSKMNFVTAALMPFWSGQDINKIAWFILCFLFFSFIDETVRAMAAAVLAAITSLQKIFFGQDHQSQ